MDGLDLVVRELQVRDGRQVTCRQLAAQLGLEERRVRVLLGEARRLGHAAAMGSSPSGATLYVAAHTPPPPAHAATQDFAAAG
ncbi:hypothetical protein GKE82_25945 [Conexibacter sp. W3-3-2]|uniref:hypothetical protein n=1 Tax=Conexibacter sp. W3-3-2 TaxID=2675227 RepID=UPI0012B6AFB6|nr:hypothetical protein [Conexibacter sp. W3-3-2]MTD47648.1 hypothetical protein [Conexibacter sp. W3-3-2]